MTSKNFGKNLAAFAAEIEWYAEKLDKANEIKKVGPDNPLYIIGGIIAERLLPIFRDNSPVDTGMLQSYHQIGDSSVEVGNNHVVVTYVIDINPSRARENPKYGGYPIDYGPEYHQERRPWFSESMQEALPTFDQLVDDQFSGMLEVWAW